ncbi:MAG: OmpA family protein [Sphingobacteriales bacterium]
MKKTVISLLLVFICATSFAQYNKHLRDLGDKDFQNKNYVQAADDYKQALNDNHRAIDIPFSVHIKASTPNQQPESAYLYYQIGESYRLYQNYLNAEEWYYRIVGDSTITDYPQARLWYAVCLRANGRFNEALRQLNRFVADNKRDNEYVVIANYELATCRFANEQYHYPDLTKVERFKNDWNVDGGNYAISGHDSSYYFTSSSIGKKNINQVYLLQQLNSKPTLVDFNSIKKDVQYSTPCINAGGNHMYLTQWYRKGDKSILAIYLSTRNNNQWAEPVMLNENVNVEGYSSIQPFITQDGKKMFFASNKPGGMGGYDIWVSDLDTNGEPINNTNLGSAVNTSFDEEAPYYDVTNSKLIFSSKGFVGLGGFDLFESNLSNGKWSGPVNMGYPMNSSKDDLYYYPEGSAGKFYISSDRESECCLNIFEGVSYNVTIKGVVADCTAQHLLADVKVSLVDSLSISKTDTTLTDANGAYEFKITNRHPYHIIIEKSGYFTQQQDVPTSATKTILMEKACMQQYVVNKPIEIKNILYDFNKATLRPESKLALDSLISILNSNPTIKIELSSYTDSFGSDEYNMNLSQMRAKACVDYLITKGIDINRLSAKGYGKTKPVDANTLPNGNDNPEGRQQNRRTEFKVIK